MINFYLINRVSNSTHPFKTMIQLFKLLNYLKKKLSSQREVWQWRSMGASSQVFKRSSRFFLFFLCIPSPRLATLNFPLTFFFYKDSGKLLYPSVTFCPKYTWKTFPGVSKIVLKIYRCIKSKTLHNRPPVKGLSFYNFR